MDEQLKRIHAFVDAVKKHAVSQETGEVNWLLVRAMVERFVVLECLEATSAKGGEASRPETAEKSERAV